jgi:aspartyl/asparaginyl-tRNA synthetase
VGAVMRVRSALAFATHQFFTTSGFQYVHTPILSASDCEGAGEMFQVGGAGLTAGACVTAGMCAAGSTVWCCLHCAGKLQVLWIDSCFKQYLVASCNALTVASCNALTCIVEASS